MQSDTDILNAYIKDLEAENADLRFQLHLHKMQLSFYNVYLMGRDNDKADYTIISQSVKGQNE